MSTAAPASSPSGATRSGGWLGFSAGLGAATAAGGWRLAPKSRTRKLERSTSMARIARVAAAFSASGSSLTRDARRRYGECSQIQTSTASGTLSPTTSMKASMPRSFEVRSNHVSASAEAVSRASRSGGRLVTATARFTASSSPCKRKRASLTAGASLAGRKSATVAACARPTQNSAQATTNRYFSRFTARCLRSSNEGACGIGIASARKAL